jgi:hypothetical protein
MATELYPETARRARDRREASGEPDPSDRGACRAFELAADESGEVAAFLKMFAAMPQTERQHWAKQGVALLGMVKSRLDSQAILSAMGAVEVSNPMAFAEDPGVGAMDRACASLIERTAENLAVIVPSGTTAKSPKGRLLLLTAIEGKSSDNRDRAEGRRPGQPKPPFRAQFSEGSGRRK